MSNNENFESLPWTGERLVTTCHRPLVVEHLHRYAIACSFAAGKRVLDIAAGEGFGANLLANVASLVIAVEKDSMVVAHAKEKYRQDNLSFREGGCDEIPCQESSFDLVTSFDTLEHLAEHEAFITEIKRVLRPDGLLVISTPNKVEYRLAAEIPNPFHKHELTHQEFTALLKSRFKQVLSAKQRLVAGSWIAADQQRTAAASSDGCFDSITSHPGMHRGVYSMAICSDSSLPTVTLGVFENFAESAAIWRLLDFYGSSAELLRRLDHSASVGMRDLPDSVAARVHELELDLQLARNQRDQLSEMLRSLLPELAKERAATVSLRTHSIATGAGDKQIKQ